MTKKIYFLPFLLLIFTISSCSLYEEVEMLGVEDYSFESVENDKVQANIEFKINNPNFYSILLKKSDFTVFLDDQELGVASMVDDLKVLKKTEGNYTLQLYLNKSDIQKNILPLAKKALFQKSLTFKITGKAHAKVWGILGKKIDINESKQISIQELMKNFNF